VHVHHEPPVLPRLILEMHICLGNETHICFMFEMSIFMEHDCCLQSRAPEDYLLKMIRWRC
jgi:hypothetical protein